MIATLSAEIDAEQAVIKTDDYQFTRQHIERALKVSREMASYEFDAVRDQLVYDLGIERGAANELLEAIETGSR